MDSCEHQSNDRRWMTEALELATWGLGFVEPNPPVGCVLVRDGLVVGRGWHQRFGGPHAEIEALRSAGPAAAGSTAYVTLEPCCHHGKTPPCTEALLAAGVARVVVGCPDPYERVAGEGIRKLRAAGIHVDVGTQLGTQRAEAERLIAPFRTLHQQGRPWVIAKWAMTLDGRMATRTGHSQWISADASRRLAHALRGRMDAVLVGIGTVLADDPLLTARPAGPRLATRIVLDSQARLPLDSRLVQTAHQVPVLVVVGPSASADRCQALEQAGCEIHSCSGQDHPQRLRQVLAHLGRRRWTNVLVEGGSQILGSLFDQKLVDEVHVFLAPKVVGGQGALGPVGGTGLPTMHAAHGLQPVRIQTIGTDIYVQGHVSRDT